jgi:hypothetical protein
MTELSDEQRRDFEAAAFRRLVAHLRERSDVQNIDLMNLAGFCRNCLSNWYRDAAEAEGVDLGKDQSREIIYGMPYAEWQALNQTEASDAKKAEFEARRPGNHSVTGGRYGQCHAPSSQGEAKDASANLQSG